MSKREFALRIMTLSLFVVGVGQVAGSQIHVQAATKIFANQIGIYLFLFIIFGLTTGFNAMLIETPRSLISFVFSSAMATVGGFVYLRLLQADVAKQEALTLIDVYDSWRLVIAAIVIYSVGLIAVPLLSWPDVKDAKPDMTH
ncbi:MAG: hypothetical protein ACPG8W_02775 [Candidatus Promineifilaceae bacterium]